MLVLFSLWVINGWFLKSHEVSKASQSYLEISIHLDTNKSIISLLCLLFSMGIFFKSPTCVVTLGFNISINIGNNFEFNNPSIKLIIFRLGKQLEPFMSNINPFSVFLAAKVVPLISDHVIPSLK